MVIRSYTLSDLPAVIAIWNEVVEDGIAFPQEDCLTIETGSDFFASQSYTGVAEEDGKICGLSIPGGFRMKAGHYENICPYYHEL